ncbi:hypothetical protein BANRA_04055 [Acinetobacter baumannii]|nr:hypothetical protein BANRA_04055 [Acinetobacter baumannii]
MYFRMWDQWGINALNWSTGLRTKDSEGWIFKTHHEWTQETGLTRREQDTARATLKSLKFISEKRWVCLVVFTTV